MDLKRIMKTLELLAPLSLAAEWDNVGLLVEPSPPHHVDKILLTNDLTPPVVQEAVDKNVKLVISYHPPIFVPLKRLSQRSWKERVIVKCVENRIAVFSPHTSWDAVNGGINDWLLKAFDLKDSKPLEASTSLIDGYSHTVSMTVPQKAMPNLDKLEHTKLISSCLVEDKASVNLLCQPCDLVKVITIGKDNDVVDLQAVRLAETPVPERGSGRLGKLKTPTNLTELISQVKSHLDLPHVRVACPTDYSDFKVKTVAVCAGSGGSVLKNVTADLYLTGEMSHHEVLHAVHTNKSVILCDHSNTERGYFKDMQTKLTNQLPDVTVHISELDADPLSVV
ncbi:hypothetical protein ScPMuIL_006154 [Solemya velum]